MSSTIYVCENQPVVVEGLQSILRGCEDLRIVGHASDLEVAISELVEARADILLIGQPFGTKSVLPFLTQAREANITASVVLWIGDLSEMDSFRALQMGARGIIRKTQLPSILLECLRVVASGSVYVESALRSPVAAGRRQGIHRITRREREIIEFVCRGLKNREIAEALSITAGTVKVHLMHIFEKTGVKDRFQLALQGKQFLGAIDTDQEPRKPNPEI